VPARTGRGQHTRDVQLLFGRTVVEVEGGCGRRSPMLRRFVEVNAGRSRVPAEGPDSASPLKVPSKKA